MNLDEAFFEGLHSTGNVKRIRIIGGSQTIPWRAAEDLETAADVVVLAPTSSQCRQPGWLIKALSESVGSLEKDGVICVASPRRWRSKIGRRLRRNGLRVGEPVVQLSSGEARYYVPLRSDLLKYALRTWSLSRRWAFVAWLLSVAPKSGHLLALALPSILYSASRREYPPFSWLAKSAAVNQSVDGIVATSWRGPAGGAVVLAFSRPGARLLAVAKRCAARLRDRRPDEGELLECLGDDAREAGMDTPRFLGRSREADWLIQSAVAGAPLSRLLAGGSSDAEQTIEAIAAWLARWNARTAIPVTLTEAFLEREIVQPARKLSSEMGNGIEYLNWLEGIAGELSGHGASLVASHNDLTMANLLQRRDGAMGLVDWETARVQGLPLVDFWYSACDIIAALDHYRDRADAFVQCFAEQGRYRALVRAHETRVRRALPGPESWFDVCFHACWLGHAVNEQATALPGAQRPFLAIANMLASGTSGSLQRKTGHGDLRD